MKFALTLLPVMFNNSVSLKTINSSMFKNNNIGIGIQESFSCSSFILRDINLIHAKLSNNKIMNYTTGILF